MIKITALFICLFAPCLLQAQDFDPKSVVPASLAVYEFGMPLETFKATNKTATISALDAMNFRIEANDTQAGSDFADVTYYFDNENNKPLYEIIVEFKSKELQQEYIKTVLKAPNFEEEWKWTTKDGYVFKAWSFKNKLVFVKVLPGTEWDESKN